MSDYRAIAAVTATLQNMLTEATQEALPGASVMIGPPRDHSSHEVSEGRINLFLYKVSPNRTWRNEELPYRRGDGTLIRKPQLALDLSYLLSFYGDDNKHIPSLLLGLAMSRLHAEPFPSSRLIPQTDGVSGEDPAEGDESGGVDLAGSGLLAQVRSLSFLWQSTEEQDVTQIWSTLFQVPYAISVAFMAKVILIEPAVVPQPVLPVRQPIVHRASLHQPRLDEVQPAFLVYTPGARIELKGERLQAEIMRVMVGELEAPPLESSDDHLGVLVPDEVQAGTHLVRVFHAVRRPPFFETYWEVVSNPVALVIQPRVLDVLSHPWRGGAESKEPMGVVGSVACEFQVRFAPPVTAATEVVLMLNESPPPADRLPRGYAFQATVEPSPGDWLKVVGDVKPCRYLVRVQIRGVVSPLDVDVDPESPTYQHYSGPKLVVTSHGNR